jgi:hypothetical protein
MSNSSLGCVWLTRGASFLACQCACYKGVGACVACRTRTRERHPTTTTTLIHTMLHIHCHAASPLELAPLFESLVLYACRLRSTLALQRVHQHLAMHTRSKLFTLSILSSSAPPSPLVSLPSPTRTHATHTLTHARARAPRRESSLKSATPAVEAVVRAGPEMKWTLVVHGGAGMGLLEDVPREVRACHVAQSTQHACRGYPVASQP